MIIESKEIGTGRGVRAATKRSGRPKAEYQSMISKYKAKREKLRTEMMAKYSWNGTNLVKMPLEYKERSASLTMKMKIWKAQIRIDENRVQKAKSVKTKVEEYLGVKIDKRVPKATVTPQHGLYFKFGIENEGLKSRILAGQLGITNVHQRNDIGSVIRRNFTRSFQDKPENRELYHRFLRHMAEEA